MDNRYDLLVETPEANLSRAIHWLNAGYCIWFNRRRRRKGHLLQGRFGAFMVEDDAGWQELARYVHLNPLRLARLGVGKPAHAASRAGVAPAACARAGGRAAAGANGVPLQLVPRLRRLR
jgi:hypothetical protein